MGTRSKPENRSVLQMAFYCKVAGDFIASYTMRHIDLRNILVDCQHNFCRNVPAKRSCRSQHMSLLQSWTHILRLMLPCLTSRRALTRCCTTISFGNSSTTILTTTWWDGSRLSSQDAQRVVVDLYTSSEAAVLSGVPQGTMLVPALLFPMTSFRNHLHQFVYSLTTDNISPKISQRYFCFDTPIFI